MTTDLETSIEYYKDLLLYQYINQPKARQTIGLLVSQALVELLPVEINKAFDLETAVGPQLDIIGEYIGLDRVVDAIIVRDYFTLDDYTSPLTTGAFGFTDYNVPTQNATASMYLYVFFDTPTNSLEDTEYRLLLKLKSYLNSSLLSIYEINTALSDLFGANSVFCADQTDMSLSYFVSEELSRIVQIAYNEALLPKPMGVLISGLFSFSSVDDLWGLTNYNSDSGSTIGFSSYTAWADATMLDYNNRIA
jgi:hypothetical protein